MTTSALSSAISQIENLLQGLVTTASQSIDYDSFHKTDDTCLLEIQPESIFTLKPFEVLLGEVSIPTGTDFSGDYGDTYALIIVRVGYFLGGGTESLLSGNVVGLNKIIADDIYSIRRCLEHPSNFHSSTSEFNYVAANLIYPKLGNRRVILTVTFKIRCFELMIL